MHENIRWFPVDELPELAFDHNEIIEYALYRLQNKVEYSRIAHSFLGEEFTLAQLREVYEAILVAPWIRRTSAARLRRRSRLLTPAAAWRVPVTARRACTVTTTLRRTRMRARWYVPRAPRGVIAFRALYARRFIA